MNKYEKLIEYIINDQESQARELFHEIVVEKSRDIYENLLVDEQDVEETVGGNEVEDLVDEITADEEGISEEDFEVDAEMDSDDMDMDFDAEGDADGEEGMDLDADLDAEEGEGEELEDRVMDLEDALDELKAEFDKLMSDAGGEEMDASDEEAKPFGESKKYAKEEEDKDEDCKEEEEVKEGQDELDKLREYVEKIAAPSNTEGADNKSSVVAKKNDMGGSAANIVSKSSDEQGGKVKAPATINSGNRNVPGAKAGSLEKAGKAKAAEEGGVNSKSIESGSK